MKLIMLGTGNGGTVDLYNTCFVMQNENRNFLVDTGGSIEIIKRLKQSNNGNIIVPNDLEIIEIL